MLLPKQTNLHYYKLETINPTHEGKGYNIRIAEYSLEGKVEHCFYITNVQLTSILHECVRDTTRVVNEIMDRGIQSKTKQDRHKDSFRDSPVSHVLQSILGVVDKRIPSELQFPLSIYKIREYNRFTRELETVGIKEAFNNTVEDVKTEINRQTTELGMTLTPIEFNQCFTVTLIGVVGNVYRDLEYVYFKVV